ncbi:hypothetical protein GC087_14695 [Pantoea sp. JZ2]|uniref:CDP-diacylglycerol diphosphatase n=1 Tax=Pantoea sp. JZ2 TaxID=2654189 RepID=UPI002B493A8E|nr:CDP-diacylglycerol diphosphatase [Pantoea sp. JZ2]WRH13772.1 hypothetical protein GC087_14695 [Pantoea sp. JZ2]
MHINRNLLWEKITYQCVPNYLNSGRCIPCQIVDVMNKFVIYKVDGAINHYLLLPIEKVTGLEDDFFLTLNKIFALAWDNTFLLSREGIDDRRPCLLSVNPAVKRSQDQLHIHISFISPDAEESLIERYKFIKQNIWSDTPFGIQDQNLYLKKITKSNFFSNSYSFPQDANTLCSELGKDRKYLTLGVTSLDSDFFILMAGFCEKNIVASCEKLSEEFGGF